MVVLVLVFKYIPFIAEWDRKQPSDAGLFWDGRLFFSELIGFVCDEGEGDEGIQLQHSY